MKKTEGKSRNIKIIGRILKDAIPISHWLSIATLFGIFSAILSMKAPELLGVLTNRIYDLLNLGVALDRELFIKEIINLSVIYLISALLSALTSAIMNYSVTRHFTCRMRVRMSDKIARMPVKTIDTTPNGEIISRMTRDVSIMGSSVHEIFGIAIMGIIRLIIISIIIFTANPIMALAVIVFVPLSMVISALLAARSEKHFDNSRAEAGRVYSLCEENLAGFDAVKIFSIEKSQNKRYSELIKKYAGYSERGYFTSGTVRPIVALINNLSYIVICILGSYLVITGEVVVGDLVAFLMYTKLFSGPLESIASGISMMQSTIASAKRVYEFLDDEEMSAEGDARPEAVRGEVVFDNRKSLCVLRDCPLGTSRNTHRLFVLKSASGLEAGAPVNDSINDCVSRE